MAMPHALVLPFPAHGHINPLILLSRRLVSMGFAITFINTRRSHQRMFGNGYGDVEIKSCPRFRFVSIPDDWIPPGRLGDNLQLFLNLMEEGCKQEFENLVRIHRVSLVISDGFIHWTDDVARSFGIPRVSFWTSSASWALMSLNLDALEQHGLLPARDKDRTIDFIPGLPFAISVSDIPNTIREEDPNDPGFTRRRHRNAVLKQDSWVLVNSFQELEPSVLEALAKENPRFVPIGPLLPPPPPIDQTYSSTLESESSLFKSGPWKEEVNCLEWLDKQAKSSVLYISFGSLATQSVEQMKEIATGLGESCVPYLWVIRMDIMTDEDERKLVLESVKRNSKGMVISWAPQLKVLTHPSVAAFLSHCGWNSLTEAIACGVPVLAWPCFAEQRLNATIAVEYWKIAKFACRDGSFVEAGILAGLVKEIVEAQELKTRAVEFSHAAMKAVQDGGSSCSNLKAFYEDMLKAI